MKIILLILLILPLTGCSSYALYRDNGGHQAICTASSFGIISTIVANESMRNCGEALEAAGYTKVAGKP